MVLCARWISWVQRMTRGLLLVEEIGTGWFDGGRKRHLRATGPNACGGEGGNRRKAMKPENAFRSGMSSSTDSFFALRLIIDPCLTL